MDQDTKTRLLGSLASVIAERDPAWMIREMDSDECLEAHLLLLELDEKLKRQYFATGGTLELRQAVISAPGTSQRTVA